MSRETWSILARGYFWGRGWTKGRKGRKGKRVCTIMVLREQWWKKQARQLESGTATEWKGFVGGGAARRRMRS
jgi:hypothetical protein